MQGSSNLVWADHIKTAPCQWLEISRVSVAGAKFVAVGWVLISWGIIAHATIRTIHGCQLYRESIRGVVDQDEGTNEMGRAERSE